MTSQVYYSIHLSIDENYIDRFSAKKKIRYFAGCGLVSTFFSLSSNYPAFFRSTPFSRKAFA